MGTNCNIALLAVVLPSIVWLQTVPARGDGFRSYDVGPPVQEWFPALIDSDGTWDIAICTAETPTRVGVFDPETAEWIDGPHELGVKEQCWEVADCGVNGSLEYIYLRNDTIRLFDPTRAIDSALWTTSPATSRGVIFFGTDGHQEPVAGEAYLRNPGAYTWETRISVRSLADGSTLATVAAAHTPRFYLALCGPVATTYVALPFKYASVQPGHPGYCTAISNFGVHLFSQRWVTGPQLDFASISWASCLSEPELNPCSFAFSPASPRRYLVLVEGKYTQSRLAGFQDGLNGPSWSYAVPSTNPYSGAAAYDLDEPGQDDWILPLKSGAGWERRELSTGAIIDTLPGMPAADLRTGPLFEPDQRDLFYIAGSIISIWGTPTAVENNEADAASIPRDPNLRAYPNPFNAGVRLTWNPAFEASTMQVFDVLGHEVRRFDLSEGRLNSVEWNARDGQGDALPSGLYFVRLRGLRAVAIAKLVLLK